MKLTIKHNDTEVIVDEDSNRSNSSNSNQSSMRWSDQNKQVQETIMVIFQEIRDTQNSKHLEKTVLANG